MNPVNEVLINLFKENNRWFYAAFVDGEHDGNGELPASINTFEQARDYAYRELFKGRPMTIKYIAD